MRFETPWETAVTLPGGLTTGDACLHQALLRPLTGREEDWLSRARNLPSALKVTKVLSDCVVSLEGHAVTAPFLRDLLVGDRDFLMLRLRALTMGDRVQAVIPCEACANLMDVDFSLDAVPVPAMPQRASSSTLKIGDRVVRFRLPSGGDQEAVLGLELPDAVLAVIGRCLIDDGGKPLDGPEREVLISEMERLAPKVELELDLTCPECQQQFVAPFDVTSFFFEEMNTNEHNLLREVHTLAFYYHWSEDEILNLRRDRRHAYLELLSEALRRD